MSRFGPEWLNLRRQSVVGSFVKAARYHILLRYSRCGNVQATPRSPIPIALGPFWSRLAIQEPRVVTGRPFQHLLGEILAPFSHQVVREDIE